MSLYEKICFSPRTVCLRPCWLFSRNIQYAAQLTGGNVVPSNNSPASLTADFTRGGDNFTYQIIWARSAIAPTAFEIHGPAGSGNNAQAIFNFQGMGGQWPPNGILSGNVTITPSQIIELDSGLWYLDVHSLNFPEGEIRGQILPVPEPSIFLLSALTLALMACFRPKRSRLVASS